MASFPAKFTTITPSDSDTPKSYYEAYDYIYVGTSGNITFLDRNGNTITISGIMPGVWHKMKFTRINATGTTATQIIAAHKGDE